MRRMVRGAHRVRAVNIARAARQATTRTLRGAWDFTVRVYEAAAEDDIFFLAGGIAFNILVTAIPFLLLMVAVFGYVLPTVVDDPAAAAVEYVTAILPSDEIRVHAGEFVQTVISGRRRYGLLGLVLFVWTSTRLIGTVRTALRLVFDLQEDRGIIAGKIFDAKMVLIAGTLLIANTAVTVLLETMRRLGTVWLLRYDLPMLRITDAAYAQLLAFTFIFVMFLLMYRYLPARRPPWRVALVAGTFTALSWELLKGIFAWYVTYVANYSTTYGNITTIIAVVFWIYYSAVVFVLGGEVGQVYDLRRIRRRQKELLE